MGTFLITLGILTWVLFSLISLIFLTSPDSGLLERLVKSSRINLIKSNGPEFGVSLMRMTGVFWVIAGVITNLIDEAYFQGFRGDIIYGIIFLTPVWIGAIIIKKRNHKS